MKHVLTIAKREFWGFLNTPTAYIVAVAFLLPSYFLFWRITLQSGEASLRSFFMFLPWFLLLLAPALTMRTLAEEKKKKTIELLIAHPVQEWQVVLGKFLGSWGFMGVLLGLTLTLPITMMAYSNPDLGQIFTQYVGALLLSGSFLAVGVMMSAWVDNVITSFLAAAAVCFGWVLLGMEMVVLSVPVTVSRVIQEIAVLPHVDQISRGVLSMRDLAYFVVVISVLLIGATIRLMEIKLQEHPGKRTSLLIGAGLLLGIGIMISVISQSWPMRLDLTRQQLYSLSPATKSTLTNLPDIVSITFYTSTNIPGPLQLQQRFIEDTLRDYVTYGGGNVRLSIVYPDTDPSLAEQAQTAGVQQIQFNTMSTGKFEVNAGYMGVALAYGDAQESIPYVQDPSNLEYELTRRIRKLTRDEPRTLGLVSGQGEKSEFADFTVLASALRTEYELEPVDLSASTDLDMSSYDAVLVVGPTEAVEATAEGNMREYLQSGGNALFFLDEVMPQYQLGIANQSPSGWNPLLNEYGLNVKANIAFDVENNQPIRMGDGVLSYLVNYPFWVNGFVNQDFSPISGLNAITLGWPGEVEITETEGVRITPLLTTGPNGGVMEDALSIAPDSVPTEGQGESVVLGAVAEIDSGTKVAVLGDANMAIDEFTQYRQVNVAFISNLVDWMTVEEGVATVPSKSFEPPVLQFGSLSQVLFAQYANILGVPALFAMYGFWRLRRRRSLTKRSLGDV